MLEKTVIRTVVVIFIVMYIHSLNAQTIDEVAAKYIIPIYEDENVRAFNFRIPANESLADHDTSSRLIILLSDLNLQRIDDGSVTRLDKHQVFFLRNTFSKGFTNRADSALEYFVAQPRKELVKGTTPECKQGTVSLISNDFTTICKSQSYFDGALITPNAIKFQWSIRHNESNQNLNTVDIFLHKTKWITWFYLTN